MGGELSVGGGSESVGDCVADEASAASTPGELRTSLAFSAKRARLASRTRLSSSPLRSASITAMPAGLGAVVGGVTPPGHCMAACVFPVP